MNKQELYNTTMQMALDQENNNANPAKWKLVPIEQVNEGIWQHLEDIEKETFVTWRKQKTSKDKEFVLEQSNERIFLLMQVYNSVKPLVYNYNIPSSILEDIKSNKTTLC